MNKVKTFKRITATVLLICLLVFTLASCTTKLHGKYTSDGIIKQSFTFKDNDKVDVSAFGIDVEGDYVIKDGKITITYSLLGLSYDWVKSFDKKGNSIFIDGTEFVKEK